MPEEYFGYAGALGGTGGHGGRVAVDGAVGPAPSLLPLDPAAVMATIMDVTDPHVTVWERGLLFRKIYQGNPEVKAVAITFDDGPHAYYTPRLLAILRQQHVRATFFVIGKMVARRPDLLRQIAANGHLIGNHSYTHVNLVRVPPHRVPPEWVHTNRLITRVTGLRVRYCRPPGGNYDRDVIDDAHAAGMTTVLWTVDPADFRRPPARVIVDRVLAHVRTAT
jgi:peptidoglycan/xylan/chitin deacetylase (PgdA/CDA1 family)